MASSLPLAPVTFSWGANNYGQLAQNHWNDLLLPEKIQKIDFIPEKICGGGGHTCFLDRENRLWSCGWNSKCQLGLGLESKLQVLQPLLLHSAFKGITIVKLSGGWDFTMTLTDQGDIYAWGSNTFCQLGTINICDCTHKPTQIVFPNGERIVDIAAGLRHAGAVTECGKVYVWGSGNKGQLGLVRGNKAIRKLEVPHVALHPNIDESGKVCQIVAGAYHTAVLTDCGSIFIWGENKHGQISRDPQICITQCEPYLIEQSLFKTKVLQIYSGWTHMLARTQDGHIYTWGRNDYGQLGRNTDGPCDARPVIMENIRDALDIQCGSEHNLLITKENKLMTWGWNEHGICGLGHEEHVTKPTLVEYFKGSKVLTIGCGAGHSFCTVQSLPSYE